MSAFDDFLMKKVNIPEMPAVKQPADKSIEAAVNYIKGYCNKHESCENCRLYNGSACYLKTENNGVPCDWNFPEKES